MKEIPLYKFYKRKYGKELLVDVLDLEYVKVGIRRTPVHRETFFCIILITKGNEEVSVNRHRCVVKEGDVICSRPGEIWKWQPDPQLQGIVLIFEGQFLLSFFNDPRFLDRFAYLSSDRLSPFLFPDKELQERLRNLLFQMKAEIDDHAEKDQHILRAMLYETLMLLDRAESSAMDADQPMSDVSICRHIDRFTALVKKEYAFHHDVEYYAGQLCITPNYLNKITRQSLGVTAKQYISQHLLEEAKHLLAYTDLSITEIAAELHFNTASYFVRLFRKHIGITPLQYRENVQCPQK